MKHRSFVTLMLIAAMTCSSASFGRDRTSQNVSSAAPDETPKDYKLDKAMKIAFKMEFNTQEEFQRVMQARHQMSNSYLNLLPHLTMNSVVASFTSVLGILAVIGDIAPFLLPSRWLQAKANKYTADAEKYSLVLMRADAGVQLEGFAYMFERDKAILTDFSNTLDEVLTLKKEIDVRESLGELPSGTADNLAGSLSAMRMDNETLNLAVREQRTFIAQAMGFQTPTAVTDLITGTDSRPISKAHALDPDPIMRTAVDKSYELYQMTAMIAAANSMKKAALFSWLDPSGDPSLGLGAGLGQGIAVQRSRVDELKIKRTQLASMIRQRAYNTVAEYNAALVSYQEAGNDLVIQNRRVKRTLESLQLSKELSVIDLTTVYQERMRAGVNVRNAIAAYKMARAKLDRLQLSHFYAALDTGLSLRQTP